MRSFIPPLRDFHSYFHHMWIIFLLLPLSWGQSYDLYQADQWTTAIILLTYKHPVSKNITQERQDMGRFGIGTIKETKGILLRPARNIYGCVALQKNQIPRQPWIALVKQQPGSCPPEEKMALAEQGNASAMIMIYPPDVAIATVEFKGKIPGIVLSAEEGRRLEALIDNDTQVMVEISEGSKVISRIHVKKSSVLFVSVSFIVLMIVSLAWLVFYYIQRFRYAQARGRTQKQLGRAAKKVIAKLPVRTIKENDQEIIELEACPVCLDVYKANDVLRVLPCKHTYHKTCVDQWLVENRTCPMCKLNILKALGYQLPPQTTEEAHYILEVGQIAFSSGYEDSIENGNGQHVEPVRTLLSNSLSTTGGGRYVRMVAVDHDRHSGGSESLESRNGSSSSEGILPPVTTTVELHDPDTSRSGVEVEESQDQNHVTPV